MTSGESVTIKIKQTIDETVGVRADAWWWRGLVLTLVGKKERA